MATNRYLNLVAGQITQVVPAVTSSGAAQAGQLVALASNGFLDPSVVPASGGANVVSVVASAAIGAGALVNVYNNGGALNVRPADSTATGSEANGFATAAIASGASGNVTFGAGLITGLSSLTIGSSYYLGTVGAATTTVPATPGNIVQYVGKGLSATELDFFPSALTVTVA